MVIPRLILAPFMAGLIEEIDHGNFKATIPNNGLIGQDPYLKCWRAIDEWQGKQTQKTK